MIQQYLAVLIMGCFVLWVLLPLKEAINHPQKEES